MALHEKIGAFSVATLAKFVKKERGKERKREDNISSIACMQLKRLEMISPQQMM